MSTPAPAPESASAVATAVRAIRARKRVIRAEQADAEPIAQKFTCAGCAEALVPDASIRGKYVCTRGACRCTHGDDSECGCERKMPTVDGIDLTLPDSVSAVRMAERITREETRAEHVIADPSGRITREAHRRGYGVVVMCQLPCAAQRRVTRKPRGHDKPSDENVTYLARAHEHERGTDGTFAVGIRTTAALGDLTGGRMDGETHYARLWEAEQAYISGEKWLTSLATGEQVKAQKANRTASNIAAPVARSVALAVQRNERIGRGDMGDVGRAMARALEAM